MGIFRSLKEIDSKMGERLKIGERKGIIIRFFYWKWEEVGLRV